MGRDEVIEQGDGRVEAAGVQGPVLAAQAAAYIEPGNHSQAQMRRGERSLRDLPHQVDPAQDSVELAGQEGATRKDIDPAGELVYLLRELLHEAVCLQKAGRHPGGHPRYAVLPTIVNHGGQLLAPSMAHYGDNNDGEDHGDARGPVWAGCVLQHVMVAAKHPVHGQQDSLRCDGQASRSGQVRVQGICTSTAGSVAIQALLQPCLRTIRYVVPPHLILPSEGKPIDTPKDRTHDLMGKGPEHIQCPHPLPKGSIMRRNHCANAHFLLVL